MSADIDKHIEPMKKAMPGIDMWNRDVNSMSAMRREKPETVVDNSNASGQEHNAGVEQTAYGRCCRSRRLGVH